MKLYDDMFQTLLAGIIADKVKLISTIPFIKNMVLPKSFS
jgi:CRISPR/Cas system CSM-associated protein Csm4 (group 5 of RAMP superfamily)